MIIRLIAFLTIGRECFGLIEYAMIQLIAFFITNQTAQFILIIFLKPPPFDQFFLHFLSVFGLLFSQLFLVIIFLYSFHQRVTFLYYRIFFFLFRLLAWLFLRSHHVVSKIYPLLVNGPKIPFY